MYVIGLGFVGSYIVLSVIPLKFILLPLKRYFIIIIIIIENS